MLVRPRHCAAILIRGNEQLGVVVAVHVGHDGVFVPGAGGAPLAVEHVAVGAPVDPHEALVGVDRFDRPVAFEVEQG